MNKTLQTAIVSALLMMWQGIALPETASAQEPATQTYQIPAGDLDSTLRQYAAQNKLQLVYPADLVEGKRSAGLSGTYTRDEALRRLLQGSGLQPQPINARTIGLKRAPAAPAAPAKPKPRTAPAAREEEVTNMPAIMVTGTRTLNMDITRTEDDPQPYVVFDREQIERSGATSLEQFLQQRLTMNTSTVSTGGNRGVATSQIRLRGLNAAETLILVDGHRVSSPAISGGNDAGSLNQADITGIPLAAIERIEILPTTASGIYGGNATGGVINIIMRRDYTGAEIKFTYGNTFSTDTSTHDLSLIAGHNWNEGRTSLLVTTNFSDANDLLVGDRNFLQQGLGSIWENNPTWFLPPIGRPPLGATPNIASSDGTNLVLDDGTPLGAAFTSVPNGYIGTTTDQGHALINNVGAYNWNLANTAQADGRGSSGKRNALYTSPTVKSATLVLKHQVDSSLQIFTDLSFSNVENQFTGSQSPGLFLVPAASPNNPFIQDIWIAVPLSGSDSYRTTEIKHHRALVGFVKQLSKNWLLSSDFTWDRTNVSFGEALGAPLLESAVADGSIDIIRDTNAYPVDISDYTVQFSNTSPFQSIMKDFNIRVSGSIWHLPAGDATISGLLAKRSEDVSNSFIRFPSRNSTSYYPSRSQSVDSAYLELRVPLYSKKNARPGLRALDLQFAIRRDDYTSKSGQLLTLIGEIPSPLPETSRGKNEFESVDPTIALRWKPTDNLALRASYGTGFLPPALNQLVPSQPFTLSAGIDPLRGNTPAGPYTLIAGGNPDLNPESSENWSAGFILTPRSLPNLRLSVDYTRIRKSDAIAFHPLGFQGLINDESLFPERIVRGPNLPDDPPEWAGPITLIDSSVLNLSKTELEAWDIRLDARKETENAGIFDLFFMGTWQPHYKVQVLSNQPVADLAGISYVNPLKIKANAGLSWSRAGWLAGWDITYFDSYIDNRTERNIANQGNGGRVPSQTYHDVFVRYDFGLSEKQLPSWLSGTEVKLGISNIFNKKPPFDAASLGLYSPFGDPRLSSYYLSITSRF